jgi:hypothetical protein
MTVEIFMILLTFFSVVTSLCTEAVKKICDAFNAAYASNLIALAAAVFIGGVGTLIYYVFNGIEFSTTNHICIYLMMAANWLGSMVGYDKVKQLIFQLSGGQQ